MATRKNISSYHKKVKELLVRIFPTDVIIEESPIPAEYLYLDFYLPHRQLAIEVHGEQHYKFNNHFFDSQMDFFQAQARDRRKLNWCVEQSIDLVILNYNEDMNEWERKIRNRA